MRYLLYLSILALLFLTACDGNDRFVGVWNKGANTQFDKAAYPDWTSNVQAEFNAELITSPVYIRIKKTHGDYVLNSYQYIPYHHQVEEDPSMMNGVKLTKIDDYTLASDNKSSGLMTSRMITVHSDPATGKLTFKFPYEKEDVPTDKKEKAMFMSLFGSDFHKLMDIHQLNIDGMYLTKKLQAEHMMNSGK